VRREAAHFAAVSRSNDLPSPSIFGLDCEKKKKKKKEKGPLSQAKDSFASNIRIKYYRRKHM
jgi:hypothetical protein